jgi:menaquinone-dependent protoporphyrinogen IX oxidase
VKTAIVYQTFLGTTRRYAEWLHESVESDIFKAGQISSEEMSDYDLIVLCSGTYVGWIRIRGYLKKRWEVLQGKKVVLLVVGAVPSDHPDSIKSYEKIPEHIRNGIEYFKLPGKIGSTNAEKVKRENLQPVIEYIQSIGP